VADSGRPSHSNRHAILVAAGIFLSRIFGFIRQRVLAHYLGLSDGSDALSAALKIPNFLQNLLGEGVLSASFIPVYARLRAEGKDREADEVANGVLGLLSLVTAVVVLVGVLAAAPLTSLLAPGFDGAKRALTVQLVRILFPGAGLLVWSAWCLGILNSHRRFLLSYSAPVVWNLAIIASLLVEGARGDDALIARAAAIGAVVGSALQFAVQLPTVLGLLGQFRPNTGTRSEGVRQVLHSFGPVLMGRGALQISGFIDTILASLVGRGAVAALGSAQLIATLPVSLFGMSVSAAELPAMSSATGTDLEVAAALRQRVNAGLGRIAFFVVPSAGVFLAFGAVVTGALFETGRFTASDSGYVWGILAGSAVGLLAATMGRLYSSGFYALRDTRTPLRFALVRLLLTTVLGYLSAVPLPALLGIDPKWGAAGLTASAGVAGWIEFLLLQRNLNGRIGETGLPTAILIRLWAAVLVGIAFGVGVELLLPPVHPVARAALVLLPFGAGYLGVAHLLGLPEARALVRRLTGGSR
jgi:putative peptidoglycan lipid II flippase